jgi:Ca2+-transporting ATPase
MITGDHPHTASAVGREIGLGGGAPESTLAEDLVRRIEAREPMDLRQVHVVARAVPAQKLAIVRALQGAGEIVAVTGDGVNDVPALQAADIGVAMGGRGTRSAREVASIVLLDDDFRTIVAAIGEGRQLFRNLQQSFLYLLLVHIPLVLSAAIVPLAGYPLLYLPIHIVLLELMIHPTALLGFQQLAPDGALEREPAAPAARFLTRGEWVRVGLVGTTLTALLVAVYVRSLGEAGHVEHARTMVLVVLVMASTAFLCVLSRLHDAAPRWIAVLAGIAVIGIVQVPTLAARLHLEPLHADDWLLAAGTGVAISLPLVRRRSRRVGDA